MTWIMTIFTKSWRKKHFRKFSKNRFFGLKKILSHSRDWFWRLRSPTRAKEGILSPAKAQEGILSARHRGSVAKKTSRMTPINPQATQECPWQHPSSRRMDPKDRHIPQCFLKGFSGFPGIWNSLGVSYTNGRMPPPARDPALDQDYFALKLLGDRSQPLFGTERAIEV